MFMVQIVSLYHTIVIMLQLWGPNKFLYIRNKLNPPQFTICENDIFVYVIHPINIRASYRISFYRTVHL